ncbi:histidine kinase [Bacillus sp. SA1-12]|uniref:sensor histidine kinase n=1 Tax=Bacillus sp. SA1-12 TaxID=1455638 RepID=UPI00062707B2|nr:HAMP domain-containing sensor histidine kinase [Bacillus sp. SA1-12]KKI90461.1 histidine kinase [Bacillus sp. SA1-12]
MNLRKSLVTKYLLLIFASLLMWPILPAIYYLPDILLKQGEIHEPQEIVNMWDRATEQLKEAKGDTINKTLGKIQDRYPKAELFWVDKTGKTHMIGKQINDIPEKWTPMNLINYLERKKQQEIFTVTASIGENGRQGFMVFQIPKSFTTLAITPVTGNLFLILIIFIAGVLIVTVSLLFFLNIRKRLIRLQMAMSDPVHTGISEEVIVKNSDEIGQLEKAFNKMVTQLKTSRAREKEEENIRKQWIANLSHDLRTPLTVIQQHAYTVQTDPSSPKAIKSIDIIIKKLNDVGKLLENLLTYTLLSAGKHPIKRENIDVIEVLHHAVVEWYPVLEKEGFQVEIDLPDHALIWKVDPLWVRCIVDNLVQNVTRYAGSGQYIRSGVIERKGTICLFIEDKGEGIKHTTEAKGAGIGLSIVSLMTKEMNIDWEISSSSKGTLHYLSQNLNKI